jgi:GT2 family glycosyltransferase
MRNMVHIILPVHNRKALTEKFLCHLEQQSLKNFHLLLVDDGSTDGTAEMVLSRFPEATVLRGQGNWWWAGSLQQGYEWVRSQGLPADDIVLIVNDDTEFDPAFLQTARDLLANRTNTLLLAQAYNIKDGKVSDVGVHANWKRIHFLQAKRPEDVNCLSTRGLFLRVCDLLKIGGFYPRLLPHYLSDYEYTIRAHRRGMVLMTDARLRIGVNEETTGYADIKSRNFLEHVKKNFSNKSMTNPIAWTVFIGLACPWQWKLTGWIIVWKRALFQTIGGMRSRQG